MKLYNIKLNSGSYPYVKDILNFVKTDLSKSYYHPNKYNSGVTDEMRNTMDEQWKTYDLDYVIEHFPGSVEYNDDSINHTITQSQFEKIYQYIKIKSIIDVDVETSVNFINLDLLAEKISNSLISKTGSNLFNNRLEVHQPNMPLFTYNDYTYITDCCTEKLQTDFIDQGYRVVAICPQPDQRRPDYILGRYMDSK